VGGGGMGERCSGCGRTKIFFFELTSRLCHHSSVEAERQTKRDEETVEWRMRSKGKEREMTDKRWDGGTAVCQTGRQVGRKAGGQVGVDTNQ
jgi:hypothetical protein